MENQDLTVHYSEGGNYEKEVPDSGLHQAVCSQIHNVGHQQFRDGPSNSPMCVFIFELDQKRKTGDFKGENLIASVRMSMYMSKGDTKLSKFIGDWRGKSLTNEERKGFSLAKLIGRPATLIISHETKDGRTFANITGISKPMNGAEPIAQTLNETPKWIIELRDKQVPAPSKPEPQAKSDGPGLKPYDDLPF